MKSMSFTQDIKAQLTKISTGCDFCDIAELSAIVRLCTSYRDGSVIIATENIDVADRICELFERVFSREADFINRNGVFRMNPELGFFTEIMAVRLKLFSLEEDEITPLECCRNAYVRGAFLGGGSVINPRTRYHMEFDTKHEGYAVMLKNILDKLSINSKITERKGRFIVYIKEYEAIADTLGAMGAVGAAMELYNVSIEKEIRNSVNRKANCELANIEKTAKSAAVQIEAIKKIKRSMRFSDLPESLREIAEARCKFPEASLKELGELINPPIGKSGVNHRLKRIMEIADRL